MYFLNNRIGYWETLTSPSTTARATFDADTIEVPQRPSVLYDWIEGAWAKVRDPLPMSVDPRDYNLTPQQFTCVFSKSLARDAFIFKFRSKSCC